jgi:hypothetical protein
MPNVNTQQPTGLSIARDGWKYTLSWKIADANYGQGQTLQYRLSTAPKKWLGLAVGATATSKTLTLSASKFYPSTTKKLAWVEFRLCGRRSNYTEKNVQYTPIASAWSVKRIALSEPKKPSASASLGNASNIATYRWSVDTKTTDPKPLVHVQYQSILVHSTETDGAKLKWKSSNVGWRTGTGAASGSISITEDSVLLASKAYARWVRVRSVGPAGVSAWRYTQHVYATPYAATISEVKTSVSGTTTVIKATWTAKTDGLHPIDRTELEYLIETPASGFKPPDGASWQSISTTRDTSGADAARATITDAVGLDQCLWVRVVTYHDNNFNASAAKVARVGKLTAPTGLTVTVDSSTFRATVTATNASSVPDSFLAVIFRTSAKASEPVVVGIITGTGAQTVTVQCPDWSAVGGSNIKIGVQAIQGTRTAKTGGDGVTAYAITANMQSNTVYGGGTIPMAAENVTVSQSETVGEAIVTWDWSWTAATAAELSWSTNLNAWESTSEPNVYTVDRIHAALWRISELEVGVRWYFRVRLLQEVDGEFTYAPYSEIVSLDLSSAPQVPILTMSDAVITESGTVTASWIYTSTDGTPQALAELCEATVTDGVVSYGSIIARTRTATGIDLSAEHYGWATGETHYFCVRVTSGSGNASEWSDPTQVSIADPVTCEISASSLVDVTLPTDGGTRTVTSLTAMPMTLTVSGAGEDDMVTVVIERTEDYQMDRPDESTTIGYEGETAYLFSGLGASTITIEQDDLIGILDDGAKYRLVATVSDALGQSAEADVDFEVHWTHQAEAPEDVTVTADAANVVTRMTVGRPAGWVDGDVVDIYRLSADKPKLIISGGAYGVEYVDPYPALGSLGGYRFVARTVNGDYTTASGGIAWTDVIVEQATEYQYIDSDVGRIPLLYNVDLSAAWKKDFRATSYLGGSIQGDWNPAVSRTGSVNVIVPADETQTVDLLRRLADHPGICHIRTLDGSSYTADVQVSESRTYSEGGKLCKFQLKIARVDSQELDGLPYDEWIQGA